MSKGIAPQGDVEQESTQKGLVAAIGLGTAKKRSVRGIELAGVVVMPFRGDAGVLVIKRGELRVIRAADFGPSPDTDATELPLLAEAGKMRPEAREIGLMRSRSAGCALEDGSFVVASTTFDSDEAVALALVELGCRLVLALDRGSHQQPAVVHRSASEETTRAYSEGTVLYALDRPAPGRAGRISE
jgi:hypothetical protein